MDVDQSPRDLARLVIPQVGSVVATGDVWQPYRLLDPGGVEVEPVTVFLRDLQAAGRAATTQRSYALTLLRWFRFLWAVGVAWNRATRAEARDFCCWMRVTDKPVRVGRSGVGGENGRRLAGIPNSVTGKASPGVKYAATTGAHSETVLRGFYDFHRDRDSGPMVNPFPLVRGRHGGRAHAHHNPLEPYRNERGGLFRPRVVVRAPRRIPDGWFDQLFSQLSSHRDRALVAFWVSTGARAAELLGALCGDVDPGQQLITVVRKGTGLLQPLPASPDAFVWLRLYQAQMHGLVPAGPDAPLWWTARPPWRALTYHAAHRMFERANARLGANWTLHDLRHTAAYPMTRDPNMPLADVQWVLGHAHLSTTQLYLNPVPEEVIAAVVAYHQRRAARPAPAAQPDPASAYREESLDVLFGRDRR